MPGASAGRIRRRPRPERVAVAAFPTGHPRSRDIARDVDALLAKQVAGANLAITQIFFRAPDYLAFVERARGAGVTIPILPGIMPITTPERLHRVAEMTGEEPPSSLAIDLEIEPTEEGRTQAGIAFAADLSTAVLTGGAPGLHLYTFNRYQEVRAVLERVGSARLGSLPAPTPTKDLP